MRLNSDKVDFLVGDGTVLRVMDKQRRTVAFSERTIQFLGDLSSALMADQGLKKYSDVMTFAFWCRRSSIESMRKQYPDLDLRRGRGLSFHIAPSNVPMMFAFSLVASLLAGNSNVVKVSKKQFEQVDLVCEKINALLREEYQDICPFICIVRYDNDDCITGMLSSICNARIIWGGNHTISSIRAIGLPPSAIELPFYDRYSVCLIHSEKYVSAKNKAQIAERFYNDTYFTDQNACTSPQLIVWLGERTLEAQKTFWETLKEVVKRRYCLQPIQAVDKWSALSKLAIAHPEVRLTAEDMSIFRIQVPRLFEEMMEFKCPGGYFFECAVEHLKDIKPICDTACQTLSFYGFDSDEIKDAVMVHGFRGVERIVPVGCTMDFTLLWDGFDLIHELSKKLENRQER